MEESIIRLLVQTTLEEFFVSQHLILGYISMISVWKEKKIGIKKYMVSECISVFWQVTFFS